MSAPDPASPPVAPEAPLSSQPPPRGWLARFAAYRLLWILGLTTLVLDQVSKLWIVRHLPLGTYHIHQGAIPVIEGFFHLVHVGNTGAAWSLFTGKSSLLALLAAFTLGAIFWWRHTLGLRDRLVQWAFGLLCGGIVGNLIDRIAYRHVVDFLDFHFGSYIYPTFNVADCGICIGVGLYLIYSLRQPPEGAPPPATEPKAPDS